MHPSSSKNHSSRQIAPVCVGSVRDKLKRSCLSCLCLVFRRVPRGWWLCVSVYLVPSTQMLRTTTCFHCRLTSNLLAFSELSIIRDQIGRCACFSMRPGAHFIPSPATTVSRAADMRRQECHPVRSGHQRCCCARDVSKDFVLNRIGQFRALIERLLLDVMPDYNCTQLFMGTSRQK